MLLAVIAGGFTADLWFTLTGAGLVATPSPGSIFAYLAVIPRGQHFAVLTGVLIGAVVSFLVGAFILRVRPVREEEEEGAGTTAIGTVPGLAD
jgi:PTS system mannitol-specific IIC component